MPMFDYQCPDGHIFEAYFPRVVEDTPCKSADCTQTAHRVLLPTKTGGVIGDEIDITVKHGLCNADGTPRRFRSRQEWRRAQEKAGLTNYVEHRGSRGSDKSKHTTRWT
jgi:hypothetical protein